MKLGLSTRNRKPTHSPKPPGLTRKPTDSMPVTVGGGSSPRKTDLDGSDGGFSSPKPDEPDPTDETRERRPDLPRSTQIRWRFGSFWLDPAMRWKFSLKSKLEVVFLFRSRGWHTDPKKNQQIRWRSSEDTAKIQWWDWSSRSNLGLKWSFLLRSRSCRIDLKKNQQIRWRSSEDSTRFNEDLAIFREDLAKIWRLKLTPTSTDPTVVHRSPIWLNPRLLAVGDGSFNLPLDVSRLVLGWAQTRPEPTCGHP